jgi:hypothetical protein
MNPQNQEKQSARLARRIKLKDKKNKGHSVLNGDVPHCTHIPEIQAENEEM